MADETTTTGDLSPSPALKTIGDLFANVRDQVTAHSGRVETAVIHHFAEKEVQSRVTKTIAAVEALQAAQKELLKIKPDQVSYDENGKEVGASYSKSGLETRRKALDKVQRIEAALLDVFNQGNFDKLNKLQTEKTADAAVAA